MSSLSKKPYRGTRDFFPTQMRERNHLFDIMRKTALSFGHEAYDGPLLEETDLYRAKSGEELINEQIYSFTDRGNREVAIRPEMTPTLARMVASVYRELPLPIRWYSIPNLMRYEKPQRGRLREHWQFNCDIFGAPEGAGELEILELIVTLFKNYGASSEHFEILINDRKVVDHVFGKLIGLDDATSLKLYKLVDQSRKIPAEALDKKIDELGLDTKQKETFKDYLDLNNFEALKTFSDKYQCSEQFSLLFKLYENLKNLELLDYINFSSSIVRGLDYYTGIVFEAFDKHPDNRRALCGGGTYANLLKIFNEKPMAGTGFGLGDVTLKDFLSSHNLMPNLDKADLTLFFSFQSDEAKDLASKLASKIRTAQISVMCSLTPVKFKKLFSLAEKRGANFVAILGEDEIKNNQIQIKNLETKDQKTFDQSSINEIRDFLSAR